MNSDDEIEFLVYVGFDEFRRNVTVNVHSDKPMTARDFIEEMKRLVEQYDENPDELFVDNMADFIEHQ